MAEYLAQPVAGKTIAGVVVKGINIIGIGIWPRYKDPTFIARALIDIHPRIVNIVLIRAGNAGQRRPVSSCDRSVRNRFPEFRSVDEVIVYICPGLDQHGAVRQYGVGRVPAAIAHIGQRCRSRTGVQPSAGSACKRVKQVGIRQTIEIPIVCLPARDEHPSIRSQNVTGAEDVIETILRASVGRIEVVDRAGAAWVPEIRLGNVTRVDIVAVVPEQNLAGRQQGGMDHQRVGINRIVRGIVCRIKL